MKVRIIRTCGIAGKHVEAGTILELDTLTAVGLITIRRAEAVKTVDIPLPANVETREPEIQQRDPVVEKPKRGRPPKSNG
jgi:hypothetical protein